MRFLKFQVFDLQSPEYAAELSGLEAKSRSAPNAATANAYGQTIKPLGEWLSLFGSPDGSSIRIPDRDGVLHDIAVDDLRDRDPATTMISISFWIPRSGKGTHDPRDRVVQR